jgi:ABC-type Na+ efflux pump permease subunit
VTAVRADSQIGAKIIPQLTAGVLEIFAAVGFETTSKRLGGDTSEWVWVTFTEDGLVSAIDALTVFLQRVRDANGDPSWSPEIDPRFFPKR